jgi:CBS domain containing-hemolysin-like protein
MAVLLVANAVFVAGEFALVAVDRSRMSLAAEAGSRRAAVVVTLLRRLAFHLSGTQLGITVTSLVLGLLTEPVVGELLYDPARRLVGDGGAHATSLIAALVLVTVVQMVVAELVPKNVAVARPDVVATSLGPLLRVYSVIFGPVIRVLSAAANRTVRALGIQPAESHEVAPSADELVSMIRTSGSQGAIGVEAAQLLTRSLRFHTKTAADALVPRLTVQVVESTASVAELAALAVSSGYSRFPVIDDDPDVITGVVLAKDVFRVPAGQRSTRLVAELAQPVVAVPPTRGLESLLAEMRSGSAQLVAVVDEFGSTAGIVTLEDVLEELVGEIDDEYDELPRFTTLRSGVVVLDGTTHADGVEEATALVLPEGHYETIAGFVLAVLDRLPVVGDVARWADWEIEVLEMDRRRISQVGVRRVP